MATGAAIAAYVLLAASVAGAAGTGATAINQQKIAQDDAQEFEREQQKELIKAQKDLEKNKLNEPQAAVDQGKEVAAAKNTERRKRLAAKGRRSTIATSPVGLTGAAPTQKKTLLGA